MGQIQTCGVQLEKTSCPCFQCPEITSCSPSSSRETGLIVPETNPPLLTEARRQQGCAWGHQCGCSGEKETPCLLCSPVTAVTLLCAGLGPGEISLGIATWQELRFHEWFLWGAGPSTLLHQLPGQLIRDVPESMAGLVSSCTLPPLLPILTVHLPRKCRKIRTSVEHSSSS